MYRLIKRALRAHRGRVCAGQTAAGGASARRCRHELPAVQALIESVFPRNFRPRPVIAAIVGPMSTVIRCHRHPGEVCSFVLTVTDARTRRVEAPACHLCVTDQLESLAQRLSSAGFGVTPMPECGHCHTPLVRRMQLVTAGRPPLWCSESCRKSEKRLTVIGQSSSGPSLDPAR